MPTDQPTDCCGDDAKTDDERPERWREADETRMINRAVVRELHRQDEYQVARWVWDLTRGMGSIDAVAEANERSDATPGYNRYSICHMATHMIQAAEAPENCEHVKEYPNEPMPELRDPDALDRWREIGRPETHTGRWNRAEAVGLRFHELGLTPLVLAWADALDREGAEVRQWLDHHDTLRQAVRGVAFELLSDPERWGVDAYADAPADADYEHVRRWRR